MSESVNKSIGDRIWITSRVRMISERKALRNQNFSYIIVTYYSLFTVILSVFSSYYSKTYLLLEQLNLSASVVVLVASLVAGGFRFESSATVFRECYLKLQKLLAEDLPPSVKAERYSEILWDYPNHSSNDYYDFIVNHTLWENKNLNSGDDVLKYTLYMCISYFARRVFYYGVMTLLFLGPLLFLASPLVSSWKC